MVTKPSMMRLNLKLIPEFASAYSIELSRTYAITKTWGVNIIETHSGRSGIEVVCNAKSAITFSPEY
jgi:hypothetical protein